MRLPTSFISLTLRATPPTPLGESISPRPRAPQRPNPPPTPRWQMTELLLTEKGTVAEDSPRSPPPTCMGPVYLALPSPTEGRACAWEPDAAALPPVVRVARLIGVSAHPLLERCPSAPLPCKANPPRGWYRLTISISTCRALHPTPPPKLSFLRSPVTSAWLTPKANTQLPACSIS